MIYDRRGLGEFWHEKNNLPCFAGYLALYPFGKASASLAQTTPKDVGGDENRFCASCYVPRLAPAVGRKNDQVDRQHFVHAEGCFWSTIETEIRRIFMDDYEWERTSQSWKCLKPHRDFNQFRETDESAVEYQHRLERKFKIPLDVIEQWLYCHYYNVNTVNNYGWIDYSQASFQLTTLTANQLASINIIAEYRPYVERRRAARAFSDFMCRPDDLNHWRFKNTWRMPPIVIDVTSLNTIPEHAELNGPLQLIEGHSRLGYLNACVNCGIMSDKSRHSVYMLRVAGV